jgi:hypothetical protein
LFPGQFFYYLLNPILAKLKHKIPRALSLYKMNSHLYLNSLNLPTSINKLIINPPKSYFFPISKPIISLNYSNYFPTQLLNYHSNSISINSLNSLNPLFSLTRYLINSNLSTFLNSLNPPSSESNYNSGTTLLSFSIYPNLPISFYF